MECPENTEKEIETKDAIKDLIFSAEEAIEVSLYQTFFSCCIPGKLYKAETLHNIRFPLGKLSEDLAVCHKILDHAQKIVYRSEIGYYYRQHNSSIMHTFNPRRMDALQWMSEIEDYCLHKHPAILNAAKCRTFNVAVHLLLDLPDEGEVRNTCYDTIMTAIIKTRRLIILDKKARKREKAAALISYLGENKLKQIWNSRVAIKQKEN